MTIKKIVLGILIITLNLFSIFLLINGSTNFALFLIIFSSLSLLFWSRSIMGNYSNFTIFFILFSIIYGLSGPINVLWGQGLHSIFSYPYKITPFLIAYNLAHSGMVLGISFFYLSRKNISNNQNNKSRNIIKYIFINRYKVLNIAILLSFIAVSFEIINIIRVGGLDLLFGGKAIFQSETSDLTLTLPSTDIMIISFSLFSLTLGAIKFHSYKSKKITMKIIIFIATSLPFLMMKVILGQRGILLTFIICLIIGLSYFRPIKRIQPKLIFLGLVVYVSFAFIYANRGIVYLIKDDPKLFVSYAFQTDRIVDALNPGANEFGAAFGNFSDYYIKYENDFTPRLGSTYIKGLVIPIPSFLYLGDKPEQITYEFRDDIFPSEASRGRIAGTGFSSILEAYMNFKYLGVIFIYFLVGYILQIFDRKLRYSSLFFAIIYVSLIHQTISFHRSAFGTIYGAFVIRTLLIAPIIAYLYFMSKKNYSS